MGYLDWKQSELGVPAEREGRRGRSAKRRIDLRKKWTWKEEGEYSA